MNQTKIQYALIAYQELTQAQKKAAQWAAHLEERLDRLDTSETAEFRKRARPRPDTH